MAPFKIGPDKPTSSYISTNFQSVNSLAGEESQSLLSSMYRQEMLTRIIKRINKVSNTLSFMCYLILAIPIQK